MADELKAAAFCECSARSGEGVRGVFDQAIRAVLAPQKTHKTLNLFSKSYALFWYAY